jgi:pimeloyl-ACP methyl ester carboxylesterase/DNA-binding CsgD family transcriptional regulator
MDVRRVSVSQQVRFCRNPEGARIAYAVTGSGTPLAMSATWLTHLEYQWRSRAWQPWLETLSRDHALLRYDSLGCGLSDRDVPDVSLRTWVRDFEAVVDAAAFDRFALLGICQGGPIAVEYAARHPERVSHLVLYGTYARGRTRRKDLPGEAQKARVLLDLTKLGWGRDSHAFLQVWASQFQPGGNLEHLRSWSELQRVSTTAEMASRLLRATFEVDVREAAPLVRCPTLVIHPSHDAVAPVEEARLLARLIPDARFVELESENHMLLPDEPAWARFLTELRAFLPRERPRRPAAGSLSGVSHLTPRERDVLERIARGLDNSEIAVSLALSEKTVRNHISRVFDKVGAANRYQAIVLAREAGLGLAREEARRPGPVSQVRPGA